MAKHHPAAFINAIAEEGTKAEAVELDTTTSGRKQTTDLSTRTKRGLFQKSACRITK
jgi:hypothetical protein